MSLKRKKVLAKDLFQNSHGVLQTPWFVEIFRSKTEIITFILGGFLHFCAISIDNRASSYWRCLPGVGGHVSPATVLTWDTWCCWDWSSCAGAHHPEGTGIVPIRQAKGVMLLFALREILYNKWKWILRSAGCQNDVCQPCLCWNLMTEDSAVAEKNGLCLWSFTVLWTVLCFALFSFLWKLLPLLSFHFLRNIQNQRMWSGHPVYSPAPTWEERTSVHLYDFYTFLIDIG